MGFSNNVPRKIIRILHNTKIKRPKFRGENREQTRSILSDSRVHGPYEVTNYENRQLPSSATSNTVLKLIIAYIGY